MSSISRRTFICGSAAVAVLGAVPAVAASGVKTLANGKTEVSLLTNTALGSVGGVVELDIKKYGKVAVVRTSKSTNGFSVINLSCPHAGVIVKQNNGGWLCPPPRGHGSEFALNGALKVGPANSALKAIKFTATTKAVTIA
ncbi:MAG: Rieske 2Fe-2S domain-containing protein [Actinobacteria bacterium]|nr:Rieske 2Fe-2S domain-containing protein [Actinomycetota bacterium]